MPLFDPAGLQPLALPGAEQAALDRRVRATDRLTRAGAEHKCRIKDLCRQLLPMSPLTGELGVADLAVLERYADPNTLVRLGLKRLTGLIGKASHGRLGADRARQWMEAAHASLALYAGHPAVAFADLAAEVATRSGCCAPFRLSWPATPPNARPAMPRSTPPGWRAACPGSPTSAGQPWLR